MNPNTFSAIAFLSGASPDSAGRNVYEYLDFSIEKWEECHDHIQWAFPSNMPSQFNRNAPIIDFDLFVNALELDAGTADIVYNNIGRLLVNYLESIGIRLVHNPVDESMNWILLQNSGRLGWLNNPHDHNLRRISRVFLLLHHIKHDLQEYYCSHVSNKLDSLYRFIYSNYLDSPVMDKTTVEYWANYYTFGE